MLVLEEGPLKKALMGCGVCVLAVLIVLLMTLASILIIHTVKHGEWKTSLLFKMLKYEQYVLAVLIVLLMTLASILIIHTVKHGEWKISWFLLLEWKIPSLFKLLNVDSENSQYLSCC